MNIEQTPQPHNRPPRLLALIVVVIIVCLCGAIVGGYAISRQLASPPATDTGIAAITSTATGIFSTAATPEPTPSISALATDTPPAAIISPTQPAIVPTANSDTAALLAGDVPMRDLRALASRLKYDGAELPAVVNAVPPTFAVGDSREFWIADDSSDTPRQFQASATLQFITPHTYWWVQNGYTTDSAALKKSAERFEIKTYPTNREFFGSEWTPGVDNDVHLSIFLGNVPGVGGYYASLNEFSVEVNPYSNAMEIFFINLAALQPGNSRFDGVLAHEFQHMIHWHQDRNEETWVNEGLSELATGLNGLTPGNARNLYLLAPDLQLNGWGDTPADSVPHYGASYLFMQYFLDRFGEDVLKTVVANPKNGITGFNDTLRSAGIPFTFDDIFADFLIANYLNDRSLDNGRWGYRTLHISRPQLDATHRDPPVERDSTVRQYGADYMKIDAATPITLTFSGDITAAVVNNSAHSGVFQWYSNRGDDSDMTLTRAVDLRSVQSATLSYWVWFDIEKDWDYAYVEVSTDGGRGWQLLRPSLSRDTNPSGNAYGAGYTGSSNGWQPQTVDLTPFAEQNILLRFEYITDDAITQPGLTLDDISIPEIGLFDNAETVDAAWDAQGFVRIDNRVPQKYTVQLITLSAPPTVRRLLLNAENYGEWQLGAGKYVLVVSAQAPVTTEPARYRYTLTR